MSCDAAAAGTVASAASATAGSNAPVGLIAGLVVGGCVLIAAVLLALFFVLGRRRRERQRMQEHLQQDPKFADCTGKVCAHQTFSLCTRVILLLFHECSIVFGLHHYAPRKCFESPAVDRSQRAPHSGPDA